MTVYMRPDGEQLVVCDRCGIADDDSHPDVSTLKKVDLTAGMIAAGFPAGTALEVRDYCPSCEGGEYDARS